MATLEERRRAANAQARTSGGYKTGGSMGGGARSQALAGKVPNRSTGRGSRAMTDHEAAGAAKAKNARASAPPGRRTGTMPAPKATPAPKPTSKAKAAPKPAPKAKAAPKAAPKSKAKPAPRTTDQIFGGSSRKASDGVAASRRANQAANEKFNKAKARTKSRSKAKRGTPKGDAAKSRKLWLG